MRSLFIAIASIVFYAASASAQVKLSLPLEGYYRPGRYFPIAIERSSEQPITLHADDAVPTALNRQRVDRSITAMLSIGADVGTISCTGGGVVTQMLKPLQSHDVLIGVVGAMVHAADARQLIPGARPLLVQLDPTHPLSGPPLAWQSLDAVVLDQWPGGLDSDELPTLLAGGMTVAVTSVAPPDQRLPWRPFAGGWALRPNFAGPLGCDGNDEAYVPSGAWHPDLSSMDRYRILAMAIVATAALSMTLLLPGRWGRVALAIIAVGVIVAPIGGRPNFQATGDVQVRRVGWEQDDRWTYFAGPSRSVIDAPIESAGWPIFFEPSQAEQLHCVLVDRGEMSIQFQLPADHRLAMVERMIRPAADEVRADEVRAGELDSVSPMARLANGLYRDAGAPRCAVESDGVAPAGVDDPHPRWAAVRCGG